MLRLLLPLLAWLAAQSAAWAAPAERANPFLTGNEQYLASDFKAAEASYEAALLVLQPTAHLYYNLGNAQYRLDKFGAAAVSWERALLLEPGLVEARQNLQLLHEKLGLPAETRAVASRLLLPFSAGTYRWLAAGAFWLAAFCFVALWLRARRGRPVLWSVGLLGLFIAAWAGLALWQQWQDEHTYLITAKDATLRSEAARESRSVANLPLGSRVQRLKEYGEWIYCQTATTQRGWLHLAEGAPLWPLEAKARP